jgi:hypothetical protein
MPGRVLNFSEFFGKYSSEDGDSNQNLDNFTQSSSNFEEGFDDSTYDQNQLGPNRPVSGGEETPSQPGENGTSVFNSAIDQSMDAPDENEMPDETEGDLDDSEEDDSEDVPEPEAGANPKKEKVEESRKFKGLKGFSQFINESDYDPYSEDYEEYPEDYDEYDLDPRFDDPRIPDDMPAYKTRWRQPEEDDYDFGMNPDSEDDLYSKEYGEDGEYDEYGEDGGYPKEYGKGGEYDEYGEDGEYDEYGEGYYDFGMNPDSEIEGYFPDDFCPNCGEELGYTPEGTSCGCNM